MGPVEIPKEIDLLSFFCVEPSTNETTIYYSVKDSFNVQLKFYFDQVSNYIGITLLKDGIILVDNSYEELKKIQIIKKNENEVLISECVYSDCRMKIEVILNPRIRVSCESISV